MNPKTRVAWGLFAALSDCHSLELAFLPMLLLQSMAGALEAKPCPQHCEVLMLQQWWCGTFLGHRLPPLQDEGQAGAAPPPQQGLEDACPVVEHGHRVPREESGDSRRAAGVGCQQALFSAAWDLAGFSTDFANVSKFLFCSFESIEKEKKKKGEIK